MTESGGSWRTRYVAVRAARLGEEHRRSNVVLRYCKTDLMAADALTKMSSAVLLDNIRDSMAGALPATPDAAKNLKAEEETWWAARVLKRPLLHTTPVTTNQKCTNGPTANARHGPESSTHGLTRDTVQDHQRTVLRTNQRHHRTEPRTVDARTRAEPEETTPSPPPGEGALAAFSSTNEGGRRGEGRLPPSRPSRGSRSHSPAPRPTPPTHDATCSSVMQYAWPVLMRLMMLPAVPNSGRCRAQRI